MKANTLKRAVALALAVLILLGTLGYFLSTVAYGLETTQGIKDVTYTMRRMIRPFRQNWMQQGTRSHLAIKLSALTGMMQKLLYPESLAIILSC